MSQSLFDVLVPQQIGGYQFKNPCLMKQAFTRKSFSEENGGENNEILEFIGDKALDIAVVRYLSERYGNDLHIQDKIPTAFRVPQDPEEFHCQLNEGALTKLKQKMVEKKALAKRIDDLGLAQFLIMGKGDIEKNIADEPSVKEDLFEAIVGAVALDSNWNFDEIQNVVEVMLCPDSFIDNGEEADYVELIYEWENKKNNCIPWFKYFNQGFSVVHYFSDPNVLYQPVHGKLDYIKYRCQLKLLDDMKIFEGYGKSKNDARKAVCKFAYTYLERNNLLYSIQDEIENPNLDEAINQLEILARRGYFSIPVYEYEEEHDEDGNPVWHVECHIEEEEYYFESIASSKKAAKKQAAYDALMHVLGFDAEGE